MRSDPPPFRRPRVPRIDGFVDRLEEELRGEIRRHPPRRPNQLQRGIDRWARIILRPVFHGGTLAVIFVLMFFSVRPQPAVLLTDVTSVGVPAASSLWVDVVQVPDPSPRFIPSVHRERAPRFVAFEISKPSADEPDPLLGLRPV